MAMHLDCDLALRCGTRWARGSPQFVNIAISHQMVRERLATCNGMQQPSSPSTTEGNFGGNQLLDSSISLSPLYPNQTNDLPCCVRVLESTRMEYTSAVHMDCVGLRHLLSAHDHTR